MSAGRLILMGSGEVANRLVAAHRLGVERAGAREAVVLDTPYGFQENAPLLSERLTGFFRTSLSIDAAVASYRSTSEGEGARERMLAAIRRARYVFAGPGSPGYALATWQDTGLAAALRKLLSDGATVTLASAAALTAGAKTLPVYEIFKAGAGLEWLEGLNLTAHLGLEAVVIPHWNNTEGQGFDTSRCYMGRRRFQRLRAMLPDGMGVIGVDEHTAATIDFGTGEMSVLGAGGVTLSGADDMFVAEGEAIALDTMFKLLETSPPAPPREDLETVPDLTKAKAARSAGQIAETLLRLESMAADGSPQARESLRSALLEISELSVSGLVEPTEWVGGYVELLVDARSRLRALKRWDEADRIRSGLEELGVTLRDSPSGTTWILEERRQP